MLIIGWSILEGLGAALMIPNIQTLLRGEYEGGDLAFSYGIISAVGAVGAAFGANCRRLFHHVCQLALGISH